MKMQTNKDIHCDLNSSHLKKLIIIFSENFNSAHYAEHFPFHIFMVSG